MWVAHWMVVLVMSGQVHASGDVLETPAFASRTACTQHTNNPAGRVAIAQWVVDHVRPPQGTEIYVIGECRQGPEEV